MNGLTEFLTIANRHTYADAAAARCEPLRPDSKDYHFEQDDWAFHDTHFGARDFIGSEVVYKQGKAVWGMNYYGVILNSCYTPDMVYGFLRQALMQDYGDLPPLRGPERYAVGKWEYTLDITGTLDWFNGMERICYDNEIVYECALHGGCCRD